MQDIVCKHLQPLVFDDQLPQLRTGKAYPKPNDPPRNPLTGAGYAAPFLNSIVVPDRPRLLKTAAEGVTVTDAHDRNPVTGDGMPDMPSIIDPKGRKRPSTAGSLFTSQIVIADDPGPTSSDTNLSKPYIRRRLSDAQLRMFGNPSNPMFGFKDDDEMRAFDRSTGKRRAYKKPRQCVLAWCKVNGNVDNEACYVGVLPMKRFAAARHCDSSPITGLTVGQATEQQLLIPVLDSSEQTADLARDSSTRAMTVMTQ